ncbi:MAG TPA: FAD-binding oxidoreductase [Acidimicrobiales bacterium]|nr:FAD-binding oxidoreductase [Acidimicrobiales bacterium]
MQVDGNDFPRTASVVIIGGGVMGVSIAYHLAAAGVRDVVLVDMSDFGSGSTCKAAGGVRAQFSDSLNIALGARSLKVFENFYELFGQEIDLHQVGYLFLLSSDEQVKLFEQSLVKQHELGVSSQIISVDEAKQRSPLIDTEGLVAAVFSPNDGHCTPESVVLGYATAARRSGAVLIPHCAANGIEVEGDQIVAVQTSRGRISTETVVCAAGAWSQRVGEWAGVHLPVTPLRRQILVTEPIAGLDPRTPFTIDFETTFYFHREGPGILLGMSDPDETPGFKLEQSDAWLPRLGQAMEKRAPRLAEVGLSSGWAGLYENTPDHNALLGEAAGPSRFIYATGFSGHGFLMGPAIGEVVRDIYVGATPFVDVAELDARRFADGVSRPEMNIV